MKKNHKNCQSCGMPLKRDEKSGGTNADGSKNEMYCSHCFQGGQFILPNLTVEQMQKRVRQKVIEFGLPRFMAGFLVKGIPKLERWQNQPSITPAARA